MEKYSFILEQSFFGVWIHKWDFTFYMDILATKDA